MSNILDTIVPNVRIPTHPDTGILAAWAVRKEAAEAITAHGGLVRAGEAPGAFNELGRAEDIIGRGTATTLEGLLAKAFIALGTAISVENERDREISEAAHRCDMDELKALYEARRFDWEVECAYTVVRDLHAMVTAQHAMRAAA